VPESVVLLHGFSGTGRAWDGVAALLQAEGYRPLAVDLPGHGRAGDCERPITFAGCVAHVLAQSPERFVLCGYSLGGRIALHVALSAPERVSSLVLVSTSAGIEDTGERERRRVADERIAAELEGGTIESFIERWRAQPLFAGDPPAVDALAREDQQRNRPAALAAALRGLGPGEMQPLWGRLGELRMPVSVLVGERDARYRELGRRMAELAPQARMRVLPGGHVLHLESPVLTARALSEGLGAERALSERLDAETWARG
jgi:2-succinyl-6-hydroxy-2,4-cyclohexadiene-1-carboxylate synthase